MNERANDPGAGMRWQDAELDEPPLGSELPPERPPKAVTLRWGRADLFFLGGLVIAVALLFGRTLFYGFTNWDDIHFLLQNPVVRGLTWENVQRAFTPGGVPRELIYIPLTYLSHMIEAELFGLRPGVVHGVNVGLHLINVCLVYVLCRGLSDSRKVALVAALIFALHPLQVEPVAWAMGRKDLLAGTAGLLSMLAYCRHLQERRGVWFTLSLGCFAAAMLVKPTMIVLPALLILLECYVKGPPQPHRWGSFLPFVLISLLGYWINSRMPLQSPDVLQPFWFRMLCIPWLGFHWVTSFFLLERPLPFHVWPNASQWLQVLIAGLIFLVLLAAVLWWSCRRQLHALWFGIWFFAIGVAPNLLLIWKPRDFITADRYAYFPLIGIAYMVGLGWLRLGGRLGQSYRIGLSLLGAIALVMSWLQVSVWSSSVRLWSRVAEVYPRNLVVLNNLGMSWIDDDQPMRAIETFERGLAVDESYLTIRTNLAMALFENGELERAEEIVRGTLEIRRGHADDWHLLGKIRRRAGDAAGAVAAWRRALELDATHAEVYVDLGGLLTELRRLNEAELVLRAGIATGQVSAPLAYNLGIVLEQQGRIEEAAAFYQLAITQDPHLPDALFNLGNIYLNFRQPQAALDLYRRALHITPQDAELLINAGQAAEQAGDPRSAIAYYDAALAVDSRHAVMVHFLKGRAWAAIGDLQRARLAFEAALGLQPDFAPARQELEALPR